MHLSAHRCWGQQSEALRGGIYDGNAQRVDILESRFTRQPPISLSFAVHFVALGRSEHLAAWRLGGLSLPSSATPKALTVGTYRVTINPTRTTTGVGSNGEEGFEF